MVSFLAKKNENPKLELCLMLTRRGPHAFANFVRCLAETQQGRVLAALAETRANLNLAPLAVPAAAVPAVPAAVVPAAVAPAASPPIEILGTPAAGHSPYEVRRFAFPFPCLLFVFFFLRDQVGRFLFHAPLQVCRGSDSIRF